MNKKITFIWLVLLIPIIAFSQKNKDFLLTMKQDTLFGKIKFNPKSEVITFYYGKERLHFHASTVDYFGIWEKNKHLLYKTLKNNWGEYIFVQVLAEGKIDLYYYDTSSSSRYTKADPYRYYIGNAEQYPIRMSPRAYKIMMSLMLKDSPKLVEQIANYGDVPRVIREYNKSSKI